MSGNSTLRGSAAPELQNHPENRFSRPLNPDFGEMPPLVRAACDPKPESSDRLIYLETLLLCGDVRELNFARERSASGSGFVVGIDFPSL